jgi:hypothetical protein
MIPMKYYVVIADIHGVQVLLDKALSDADAWIEMQKKNGTIRPDDTVQFIFLGDYIDRGANPKYVLAKVKEYVLQRGAICLLGNHDQFLIGTAEGTGIYFADNGRTIPNAGMWYNNGGIETCKELFGRKTDNHFREPEIKVSDYVTDIQKSEEYEFLKTHAKRKHETDLIFFCHAQQSDAKEYDETTLIWGRNSDYGKLDSSFKVPGNKAMSVHGHFHRLDQGITFPRIFNYVHGGKAKTVVMADCGCGCGCGPDGALHPVIIAESSKEMNGLKDYVSIVAIL